MHSLTNRMTHHRRSSAPDDRGPIAVGTDPAAVVYVLSIVAMIVAQVTS